MLIAAFSVEILLMVGLPLAVWLMLSRRWEARWSLIGAGAITFVASQFVHLPLNWALGLLGGGRGLALLPPPAMAAAAGLSAGICEGVARYLAFRFWRREARSWREGIVFGAGYGGIEAILLGLLVLVTLIQMLLLRGQDLASLGLSSEALEQLEAQVPAYWSIPWYTPLLGGLERVFALTMHVAWSLLVLRSVQRNNLLWLAAAILSHALVDGLAVGLAQAGWALLAVEGALLLFALGAGALIWLLRPGEDGNRPPVESD